LFTENCHVASEYDEHPVLPLFKDHTNQELEAMVPFRYQFMP
jgi:hypothetical protein